MILKYVRGLLGGPESRNQEAFERTLLFQQAMFETFAPQSVDIKVHLDFNTKGATVCIEGSGDWTASYNRNDVGAETFEFETNAAEERITVSPTGEAIWELQYRDPEMHKDRVIAFAGLRLDESTSPASV